MSRRAFSYVLALFVLLVGMPTLAGAAVFNPQSFTLKNGMQVVVITNHRVPVVTHMVWYKIGAMDEPAGKSGLAHYLEHLMFKGTKTLKPGEFSAIVARNGGRENAFTSQDYTGYFQSVAVDRLPLMMKIEADRMTNLVLTDDIIEPERAVVIEERRSRVDRDPSSMLGEQIRAVMFQNHPYQIPIIGWQHEIEVLTRKDLIDFYKAWYAPNNAILVISGDITVDEVRPLAEKYYGPIPAKPLPERVKWAEPPLNADLRVVLEHSRVRQPSWSRRFIAPSQMHGATEHADALQVLGEILSGGATSRLYRKLVVERKAAVSAGGWYSGRLRGPGTFGFYISPPPGGDLEEAGKAMNEEIDLLIEKGVTEEEVKKAVQRLQDSAIYARDSYRTPARVLGGALAIGQTVEDIESWPERIGMVTVDAVNRAIAHVFKDRKSVTSLLLPKPTT
ncbi:MAG: pitrilysin family protein [Rhodospirillaceae bacterium]|nr:pitrilysin family protein [Rhodospirillaceae bacterium]MDD9929743.1 pitrilysin family protein [Rhodospirillaceae bacterium]